MSKDNPRQSFSQKLREIGRIRVRQSDLDKRDSPSQLRFQIVHTPDRLTPGRPTPTEEECREEIMRWHAEADRVRGWSWGEGDEKGKKDEVAMMAEGGGEEGLGRGENHGYGGVGIEGQERGRRRFAEGSIKEGEEQQDEEIKKKKKNKKRSGKNKYEFDDGSGSDGIDIDEGTALRTTGRIEARAEDGSWDISNRRNRDTFGQDQLDGDPLKTLKRDDTKQRSRQQSRRGEGEDSRVNADRAAHYSYRDSNDGYPIFHPPKPHRPEKPEFSTRKDIPPMFIGSQAVPVAAKWDADDHRAPAFRAPVHAPIPIRPLRPRSPSISSLANVSDDSDEGASGSRLEAEAEAAAPVDKDRLIRMELRRRGVCPFCRKMLSRIEAVRCSGCGADLMSTSSSNRPRKKEPAVSRLDVPRIQVTPLPQSSSAPPVVVASAITAAVHRSPPRGRPPEPLRKRLYQPMLDVHEKSSRENAQAVADKNMIRFAHFPLEPLLGRSKSDGERARGQHTQQQPQLQRRNASAGRKKDKKQKDRVSEYHRWQTPAQRAEMRRLIHENGDDADLFMDIYSGYDD